MKYAAYAAMKLPPIWAEYALLEKPDKTKSTPPIIADNINNTPNIEDIFAPFDFVLLKVIMTTIMPRIKSKQAFKT